MAELKTRPTGASVAAFLAAIEDDDRRKDCRALDAIMRRATGDKPRMWGPSIVGYGSTTVRYADGRELDWPVVGFSPRKQALTVYIMGGLTQHAALLARLGKHKRSAGGCIYVKHLADVDAGVLEALCERAHANLSGGRGPTRQSAKRARRRG
jgi:hypothetical protein